MLHRKINDIPTTIANLRENRCAQQVFELLALAQNIDVTLLPKVILEPLKQSKLTDTEMQTANNQYNLILGFCKNIQTVK